MRQPPTSDPRCGTDAGYKAHYRRNENPCAICRAANSRRNRQYRLQLNGGVRLPHHDEHCSGCGWYLKVEWSGMTCVNRDCSNVGECA